MRSKLGLQGSALGAGTFNLGTAPGATPPPRQGAAFLAVKYVTGQRVSQVAVEASAQLSPPSVAVSQVAAEITTRPSLPPVYLTQVAAEATALPTTPPLNSTQVVMEAVIFAPPTRFGLASIMLAGVGVRSGVASLRARGTNERERTGNAYLWTTWSAFAGGGVVPDPTPAPVLSGSTTGGTLGPGTYQIGYTWVTPYGESKLSPISTVTLTGATSSLGITWPALPPGVLGVRLYVSGPGGTTLSQQNATPLGGTSSTLTAPPVDTGLGPPSTNTTAWTTRALDHDFRDPTNACSPGTLGWQPADPTWHSLVVRSGETDIGVLPVFDGQTQQEILPSNGSGTWIFNQYPPVTDPFEHNLGESTNQTTGVGTIPPGHYWIGFTWLDPAGHETPISQLYFNDGLTLHKSHKVVPDGTTAQWGCSIPFPVKFAVPPAAANVYVSTYRDSTAAEDLNGTFGGVPISTFVRQNATPIPSTAHGYTLTSLVTTGAAPPTVSNWPAAEAPRDANNVSWVNPAYVVPGPDSQGEVWHRPYGGYGRDLRAQGQTQGLAIYDPHWRSLPTATVLCDQRRLEEPADQHVAPTPPTPIPDGFGPRTYFRHVWYQPGTVVDDARLTMRYNGSLEELYINGTFLGPVMRQPTVHWRTLTVRIPATLLVAGRNVLGFKIHTSDAADYGHGFDAAKSANGDPTAYAADSTPVHVPSAGGTQTSNDQQVLLRSSLTPHLQAFRPDGTTRQYWQTVSFTTSGAGFVRGTGRPGFGWTQTPGSDDGPGLWGYFGDTHQPEFRLKANWGGRAHGVSSSGTRQVLGPVGPAHWPPRDDGFGMPASDAAAVKNPDGTWPNIYQSPTFSFAIGDESFELDVDRFSMIGVGRIGGGGQVQVGAHIPGTEARSSQGVAAIGSSEWAPGACFLMTIPTQGGGWTERTAFNEMIRIDAGYPFDADPYGHPIDYAYPSGFAPWSKGRVVATVPVQNLSEVFISAVSRDPTAAYLGKARMWVNWLDASQQVGGALCSDNEFLHATFGNQPATLWPYSENHFWLADYFGTAAWRSARYLQVVLFNHHDNYLTDPIGQSTSNEWLINITVREKAAAKHAPVQAQWVIG